MKKMNELMKDLGFNPNGSDSVKEAFIKNLIKASYGVDVVTPTDKKIIQANPDKIVQFPNQLAFDFVDPIQSSKKSVS
jgi:hypothetical protein